MPSTSNDHGRAFECMLVNELISDFPNFIQTDNCVRCQQRDETKINELDEETKLNMQQGCTVIKGWMRSLIDNQYNYNIDRLDDTAAISGDVTDVSIYNEEEQKYYNFSIKHNHSATKHQRIPALMQSLGFEKDSDEDRSYRSEYNNIKTSILTDIRQRFPNTTQYSEIKMQNPTYIDENIYRQLCVFYMNSINNRLAENIVQNFFKFLIGNVGFYKCINFSRYVEIMDFTNIRLPSECNIQLNSNSHIGINFNNGFVLDMRLHNASSHYANLDLKFDTQIVRFPDNLEIIKINK